MTARVLVVDDLEVNRSLLTTVLGAAGYSVSTARTAEEAFASARDTLPQLVISDVLMPDTDGYAFCRQWSADARLGTIPVILYSATILDDAAEQLGRASGARMFVAKPQEPESIVRIVGDVLAGARTARISPAEGDAFEHEHSTLLLRKLYEKIAQLEESERALRADIERRRRLESALQTSEKRYRTLFESSLIGMFIANRDGRMIEANDTFLAMTGYDRSDLAAGALQWGRLIPPGEHPFTVASSDPEDTTYLRKDGTLLPVRVVVTAIDEPGGDVLALVSDHTKRRAAENSLRDSEQQLRNLLDGLGSRVFVGLMDLKGRILWSNRAVHEATGRSGEAIDGQLVQDAVPWEESETTNSLLEEAVERARRGEGSRFDVATRDAHGGILHVDFSLNPLRGVDGTITYLIPSAIDITERKLVERALRESEARLSSIVGSAMDAIISLDEERRVTLFNTAAEKMFGCEAAAALGRPAADFLAQQGTSREEFLASLDARPGLRGIGEQPLYGIRSTREEFPVEASVALIREEGRTRYTIIVRDITERSMAEAALRASEERLRLALEAARMGMFDWDLGSQQITWSPSHEKLWGFSEGQFDGSYKTVIAGVHPDDTPRIERQLIRCVSAHERFDGEFRVVWPDDSVHWMLSRGEFVFGMDGEPRRMVGTVTEITERMKAAEELQQANDRLQALSRRLLDIRETERRMIARELHDEIGQVLTATKINLQTLARYHETLSSEERLADSIGLVERALAQVRSLSLDLRPPLLDDLGLTSALRWLTDRTAKSAAVDIELRDRLPAERFDSTIETACFRIVQEALNNVVKHAGARKVTIDVERIDATIQLRVADDGKGFDLAAARAATAAGRSLGLRTIEDRASLVGGMASWKSIRGEGTELHVWLALPRQAGESH